jgi:hypothetical protein
LIVKCDALEPLDLPAARSAVAQDVGGGARDAASGVAGECVDRGGAPGDAMDAADRTDRGGAYPRPVIR